VARSPQLIGIGEFPPCRLVLGQVQGQLSSLGQTVSFSRGKSTDGGKHAEQAALIGLPQTGAAPRLLRDLNNLTRVRRNFGRRENHLHICVPALSGSLFHSGSAPVGRFFVVV